MPISIPDSFPARQYQWVLSSCIRIEDDVLHVYYETIASCKEALENPYELAQRANNEGCEEMFLYVVGCEKPHIKLVTANIITLGRKLGFIGHPSSHASNRKAG